MRRVIRLFQRPTFPISVSTSLPWQKKFSESNSSKIYFVSTRSFLILTVYSVCISVLYLLYLGPYLQAFLPLLPEKHYPLSSDIPRLVRNSFEKSYKVYSPCIIFIFIGVVYFYMRWLAL